MDDEVCTTHTHMARLRVMQTTSERDRGIVHLHRIGEDPGTSEQHDSEGDFASDVEARDAARTLARRLLEEQRMIDGLDSINLLPATKVSPVAESGNRPGFCRPAISGGRRVPSTIFPMTDRSIWRAASWACPSQSRPPAAVPAP